MKLIFGQIISFFIYFCRILLFKIGKLKKKTNRKKQLSEYAFFKKSVLKVFYLSKIEFLVKISTNAKIKKIKYILSEADKYFPKMHLCFTILAKVL